VRNRAATFFTVRAAAITARDQNRGGVRRPGTVNMWGMNTQSGDKAREKSGVREGRRLRGGLIGISPEKKPFARKHCGGSDLHTSNQE